MRRSVRKAINFLKRGSKQHVENNGESPSSSPTSTLGKMPADMSRGIRWLRKPSNDPAAGSSNSNTESDESDADTGLSGTSDERRTGAVLDLDDDQVHVLLPASSRDTWPWENTENSRGTSDAEPEEELELHRGEGEEELDSDIVSNLPETNENAEPTSLTSSMIEATTSLLCKDVNTTSMCHSESSDECSAPPHQIDPNRKQRSQVQQQRQQHYTPMERHHGRLHIPTQLSFHGTLEEGRKLGFISPYASIHKYESFGIFGLYNIGNTCYMNCVLQCLTHTKPFIEFMLDNHRFFTELTRNAAANTTKLSRGSGSGSKKILILCYKELISTVWKYSPCLTTASHATLENIGDPTELKLAIEARTPMFKGRDQHDAHEFFHCFLDRIHGELNRSSCSTNNMKNEHEEKKDVNQCNQMTTATGATMDWEDDDNGCAAWENYLRTDNSIIVDLFVGQLKSTLTCVNCGLKSIKYEAFWDLSVPISTPAPPEHDYDSNTLLEECLQLLLEENTLDQDNLFHCSHCAEQQKYKKSLQIERFPHILVIHLKRFSSLESKILTPVEYPVHGLDMGQFGTGTGTSRPRSGLSSSSSSRSHVSYNLYGIVDHLGDSHLDGHYVVHCKHPFNYFGSWYSYDDISVSPVLPSNCSSDAYMLLYEMSLASRDILNM